MILHVEEMFVEKSNFSGVTHEIGKEEYLVDFQIENVFHIYFLESRKNVNRTRILILVSINDDV